jgi:hypothetical protein
VTQTATWSICLPQFRQKQKRSLMAKNKHYSQTINQVIKLTFYNGYPVRDTYP